MRIFTLQIFFSIIFIASALSAGAVNKTFVPSTGNWSVANNWSPSGVPTTSDAVYIPNGKTVVVDIAIADCNYLVIQTGNGLSALSISGSNTLNVTGNVDIADGDPNTLAVNGGTLNVGGNVLIQGNGNKTGKLTVTTGLVNVLGNFGFVAIGVGNEDNKIVDVTGSGSIVISGQFTNPSSGTITPQSVDNLFIRASYYKSVSSGDWSLTSTWLISRDNVTFYPSPLSPNASALGIEIVNNHIVTLSANSPAAYLVVNGTLDCSSFIVNGPGPFTLSDNATIIVKDVNGIDSTGSAGAIQVTGKRKYSSKGNYTFRGTQAQQTGTGLPAVMNGILTSDNPVSLTLTQNTLLTNLLRVEKGTFISNQESKGILTLESRADSYANVGPLLNGAKVMGHVNVQSFFTGGSGKRGSRMVSSPVVDDAVPTVYQQLKEKMVITGPGGVSNGFDIGGGNANAVTLSTYFEPANAISSFVAVPNLSNSTRTTIGKAVFVFFRGDRNNATGNKVNIPYAVPEDVFGNYKGSINQGDVSIEITHSNVTGDTNNGINAVGNPYPAAIDWEKVYATNSGLVDNVIRIIKPGGGMVTRKMVGSTPQTINSGDQLGSQFIQPGQGFYIQKSSAGSATFKFLESHKAVNNYAGRILSVPSSERMATQPGAGQRIQDIHRKEKLIRINIQQNDLKDETLIVFEDGFSPAFDRDDAIYFAGNTVLVGSVTTDNNVTSINAMPDVKDVEELRLYVSASASGAAKLNFTDVSAGEGCQIFLKDALFPDKLVDLKLQTTYEFNIDKTNVSTYGTARFSIIFKPELVEAPTVFIAQKVKSNVELSWTTQVAPKVKYFEVEVSADKIVFQNLGKVINAGTDVSVNYSFVDKSPVATVRYYRLKQFNINGSITYTEPRMIDLSSTELGGIKAINVYPNPATSWVQVEFSQLPESEVQATIFNVQGKKIEGASFAANKSIRLDIGRFPQGIYLLELRDPANQKLIGHSKFIIGQ